LGARRTDTSRTARGVLQSSEKLCKMAGLAARAPNQQDATEASARELRKPVVKEYDPHGDSHCSSQQWYTLVRLHDYGSAGHVASDEELRELEERILSEPDTSDDDALETLSRGDAGEYSESAAGSDYSVVPLTHAQQAQAYQKPGGPCDHCGAVGASHHHRRRGSFFSPR